MDSIQYWLDEIADAQKREKDWRKKGREINDIYDAEDDVPFNILYSNTEVLLPALYSQLPRPVFKRRFKDDDPVGKHVCEAAQRMVEYLTDTDLDDHDKFDDALGSAALDGLLPGRGVTAVKYDANILNEGTEGEMVEWETVFPDAIKWDRVLFGHANKWTEMPWIAYELFLDKKEAKRLNLKHLKEVKFTEGEETDEPKEEKNLGKRKTAQIYQIWDKADRKVKYLCPQYKEAFLREDDDPLELPGFFNCPKPIQFHRKSNNLKVTPIYTLYENQAKELNTLQKRINRIIDAIKVRGAYDGALGTEIEKVLKESDNALIPTDKTSALLEGGFDKAIWFLPLGELIAVAQQLYQARESCKRVIYEITGISDIIRGQSMASETLGAQKIKESWGTMRLKSMQKEVQRYALETMKMMLDIAISKFSPDRWKQMTALPYPLQEEKQQAIEQLQLMKQQYQQQVQQAQQMGQQPQPFNPDPRMMQAANLPAWEEILSILGDNYKRSYRIDIETNSTLDIEATEDKQQVAEFMNAMAQFMNGIAPLVESKSLPFGAAKEMMLEVVRRYRFGREVEDQIKQMQEPKPQQNPEMQKQAKQLQQEKQKLEQEKQQLEQAKIKLNEEAQKKQAEDKLRDMQANFDKQLAQMELKYRDQMAQASAKLDQAEAQNKLKELIAQQKRDFQSMLDKHKTTVEMAMIKSPKEPESKEPNITIVNEIPDKNKSISINRDKSGKISGADVKDS